MNINFQINIINGNEAVLDYAFIIRNEKFLSKDQNLIESYFIMSIDTYMHVLLYTTQLRNLHRSIKTYT